MQMERTVSGLKRDYVSVGDKVIQSFGGNQEWFEDERMKKFGCGLIGVADILWYMNFTKAEGMTMSQEEYFLMTTGLRKKYFHLIPALGITGWGIARGMNRYFRKHKSSMRAHWGVKTKHLQTEIVSMLEKDIPVLLSVGPNWPKLWGRQGVSLYSKPGRKYQEFFDHYVVVTSFDGKMLEVSSWGKRYFILFEEYLSYIRQYSCGLFSNILFIAQKQ